MASPPTPSCLVEGPASALGQGMRRGILAAFNSANRAGGIHGRTLKLISRDDAYEPDRSIVQTTKLIQDDKVFALIGAIVAEFVGSTAGLGMLIQGMNFNMDVAGQFSVLLILSILGLLLNRCILLIRRRVIFWDTSERKPFEEERIVI